MANPKLKEVEKKIYPVKPFEYQQDLHRYTRFDCIVPSGLTNKDLENPDLWVNVAGRMKQFDEVRVIADDHSFVAYLLVLFVQGTDAKLKLIMGAELEDIPDMPIAVGKYDIKLCGAKKYVIFNTKTGEHIKDGIPTKIQALKELQDYETALRM